MSIINDALKKANDERNSDKSFSRTIKLLSLIIILAVIVTYSYSISHRKNKEKTLQPPTAQSHVARVSNPLPSEEKGPSIVSNHPSPPPAASGHEFAPAQEPPQKTEPLKFTGIIRGEGKLLAVINDTIVEERQTIGGMKVKKIYNDHVILGSDGKEYTLILE